jgi:hypothetical protein
VPFILATKDFASLATQCTSVFCISLRRNWDYFRFEGLSSVPIKVVVSWGAVLFILVDGYQHF